MVPQTPDTVQLRVAAEAAARTSTRSLPAFDPASRPQPRGLTLTLRIGNDAGREGECVIVGNPAAPLGHVWCTRGGYDRVRLTLDFPGLPIHLFARLAAETAARRAAAAIPQEG